MREDIVGKEMEIRGKAVSHILQACPLPFSPLSTNTLNRVGRSPTWKRVDLTVRAEKRERKGREEAGRFTAWMARQYQGRRGGEDRWRSTVLVHLQRLAWGWRG
jgi:hypothetical protein